ncbi:MAG: class I SAM-dependent methyltransferase [Flammeovirgaceae bacterium]|nr:class I SAM-dependent methyltransferase [Flammeovirgaceae bacterium]
MMSSEQAHEIASRISASPWFIKNNFIRKKSFSIEYFCYRILRPLLKLRYKIFKLFNPLSPWTSQASIQIFKKILNTEMKGFEYGSGNSTLFFAQRLQHLTSVEHNKEWHQIVNKKLTQTGTSNIDYHLIPRHDRTEERFSFHSDFNLDDSSFSVRTEYSNYFSFIKKYPDQYFDFIIVDGRARVECCLNAIPKLKPGGIFVLDNSDRERYQPIFLVLSSWKQITTTTGLFDTTIWFKPSP